MKTIKAFKIMNNLNRFRKNFNVVRVMSEVQIMGRRKLLWSRDNQGQP